MSLRRAGVTRLSFEGHGERIAKGFYIPVLRGSVGYDRATGYFSVKFLALDYFDFGIVWLSLPS